MIENVIALWSQLILMIKALNHWGINVLPKQKKKKKVNPQTNLLLRRKIHLKLSHQRHKKKVGVLYCSTDLQTILQYI